MLRLSQFLDPIRLADKVFFTGRDSLNREIIIAIDSESPKLLATVYAKDEYIAGGPLVSIIDSLVDQGYRWFFNQFMTAHAKENKEEEDV